MENITELIERLLEIQSGGRQRSPKLVAEDERLVDSLRNKSLTAENRTPLNRVSEQGFYDAT